MNITKLRNKLFNTSTFSKISLLFILIHSFAIAIELSVEEAASKWIEHSKKQFTLRYEKIDFHPSEILDIIARKGHTLPTHVKNDLTELGFNFSDELVRFQRPIINNSLYVDSGIFRFHYTLTGVHAVLPEDDDGNGVPDYVDFMKQTFDDIDVIDFGESNFHYVKPPSDDWYYNQENGGSHHFDVYIYELPDDYYGFVAAEEYANNIDELSRGDNENSPDVEETNAFVSWMGMRNNYSDFPGVESSIIEVTSAHEFFHAIQYGYDGWERNWIKEASAVWMEEVHYDHINDCYQYLPLFFGAPELGPNYETLRMYGSYIYVLYLVNNHFGSNFVKSFWENSVNYDSYEETDYSITTLKETMDQYKPDFSNTVFNDNQFEKITNDFLTANALVTYDPIYPAIYLYEEEEVSNEKWPINGPSYGFLDDSLHTDLYGDPIYDDDDELIWDSFFNPDGHLIDSLGTEPTFIPNKVVGTFGAHYYKVNVSDPILDNISIELLPYSPDEGNLYLTIINNTSIQPTHMSGNEQVLNVTDSDSVIFFVSAFTYTFPDLYYAIRIVPNSTSSTDNLNIDPTETFPHQFYLMGNYPNPFNPLTNISYSISQQKNISIRIFNIKGQLIKLISSGIQMPGQYSIIWDATDINGNIVESGMYFYNLNVDGKKRDTQKMLLLK